MKCQCGVELIGGIDTFGSVSIPLCWLCYSSLNEGYYETWYGLAPHHHDLTLTGSIIGSTVFDDRDDPNFIPDPDVPGLGIWTSVTSTGWK